MAKIVNYSGINVEVACGDGHRIFFSAKKCPLVIIEKRKMATVVHVDEVGFDIEADGYTYALSGEGFPGPKADTLYIVSDEMVQVLRKLGRGASDLLVAEEMPDGTQRLRWANRVSKLHDNPATEVAASKTYMNSLHFTKYDEFVQGTSDR